MGNNNSLNGPNVNPIDIKNSIDIIKDDLSCDYFNNSFLIFKSINGIIYLLYSTENKSIITFDLVHNKKINEIKNAHNSHISNFKHIQDIYKKRDLIITISCFDSNVKIWNASNWECICNIKSIYLEGHLRSASYLNDKSQYYIIVSNTNSVDSKNPIIVFGLNGKKIKEINDSCDKAYFIDAFYDEKFSTNYIITGNDGYVKSFDYNKNKLYHTYTDYYIFHEHYNIIIYDKSNVVKMIDFCRNGIIRIWDFHSRLLLNRFIYDKTEIFGGCLWNDDYLYVAFDDNKIKLLRLKDGKIVHNLISNEKIVIYIQKINLPKYGECMVSQGYNNEYIKLWAKSSEYS